jgi:pimeloyl-ACP methyl ester carboxylesterase
VKRLTLLLLLPVALTLAPARAAPEIGTSFPDDFPVITDGSLGTPVLGFGSDDGAVTHSPVVFLHGNNDTPYPTTCNNWGDIHNMAQHFADHGYSPKELWGLGYQGDQCDLVTSPTNKSGEAHSTVANVPDLRAFVHAVLDYTGASQVDIVGHSLGGTLAREWLRQDDAYDLVRRVVAVDSPHHGIINCSPDPANYFSPAPAGGFDPDSAICVEYGSDHTPLLATLNGADETPGPTEWMAIVNADQSFVYYPSLDGAFPPVPAEDREGNPHDFSRSAWLDGATVVELVDQDQYDEILLTAHLGIINSPDTWAAAYDFLTAPPATPAAAAPTTPPSPAPAAAAPVVQGGTLAATGGQPVALVGLAALLAGLVLRRRSI